MKQAMEGRRFYKLIIIERSGQCCHGKHQKWLCLCDCGNKVIVDGSNLRHGFTSSCGCLRKKLLAEANKAKSIHGMASHPLYPVWHNLIRRCKDPRNKFFHRYGGRGITVCPEWENDPAAFIQWALENGHKKGLQIDRIDNDKGYFPDNCRFVTAKINANNRAARKAA